MKDKKKARLHYGCMSVFSYTFSACLSNVDVDDPIVYSDEFSFSFGSFSLTLVGFQRIIIA